MKKVVYKYFFDFLKGQEQWLNNMAKKGYRLVKVGKITYEFEKCRPQQYIYCVEFVADKSNTQINEYKNFLEHDIGYKSFKKNININWSFGKIKFRPWSNSSKIATSSGSYNKELLILEKENDGIKFNLHTTNEDLIRYISPIAKMHLLTTIILTATILLNRNAYNTSLLANIIFIVVTLITIFFGVQSIKYFGLINKYKKNKNLYE